MILFSGIPTRILENPSISIVSRSSWELWRSRHHNPRPKASMDQQRLLGRQHGGAHVHCSAFHRLPGRHDLADGPRVFVLGWKSGDPCRPPFAITKLFAVSWGCHLLDSDCKKLRQAWKQHPLLRELATTFCRA